MTPNRSRVRWVIADPDTGAVIAPEFAVAIDLDRLTAEQIDAATDASELDAIPADILANGESLAGLLADGLRWRAHVAGYAFPEMTVSCAACNLAGNSHRWIDPRTALVVPWDVMGDPRAYALVCPECAEVTPPQCSNCGNEWGNIAPIDDEPSSLLYCTDCRNEYNNAEGVEA